MRLIVVVASLSLAFSCPAFAKHPHKHNNIQTCTEIGDIMRPSCGMGWNVVQSIFQAPVSVATHIARTAVGLANGLVGPLEAKVEQIESSCGSRIISGVRHTYVAGTHRISLHSYGEAADMQGNPRCMYLLLHDWPGGYSVDYNKVHHIHISYEPSGREWGARFVHGGHHRRHHHRRK